ncbi:transcriptional regulator [Actinoallomurus iriomotensis]|uniref:Transcriptional regulator n=1 Tax=Actinoallomurus iriomotensis TaxID=478107 RepID=A0A9W6VQJ6_9ACTN|nr:transcriptional regulator [Actinoallomurus iriomotensis]
MSRSVLKSRECVMGEGGTPSRLRRLNSADVLAALYARGPRTLSEVSEATGLSRPTVEDVVDDFVGRRVVRELPPEPGGAGRPARRFRFAADEGFVAGVDIGVHTILVMLADLEGEVRHVLRTEVSPSQDAGGRLSATRRTLERCLTSSGVPAGRLRAVGIGTPGVVRDGTVTLCTVLPGWTGLNLPRALGAVAENVVVGNDANLATVAEHWRGASRHVSDAVCLLAGNRIAAGILIGGRLHRGHRGGAGELGLLPVLRWEGAPDRLLAAVSSAGDLASVFAAARDGEPEAVAAVETFTDDLATGAAALLLAVDPALVVVGGGLSRAGDLIITGLRERLSSLCPHTPEIVAGELGDEAVATGAVCIALERATEPLFPSGLPI